jgi:hypothetical protein
MDINIATLEIINSIIALDYYDMLTDAEISKRSGSYEKLNKIRDKSSQHMGKHFEGATFVDGNKQLFALSKLKEIVGSRIGSLGKKEIEELSDTLAKDAKKISRLYKEITK